MKNCLWILAFTLFGYVLSNVFRAIILKTVYDAEGGKKVQMYNELEPMRAERHKENEAITAN